MQPEVGIKFWLLFHRVVHNQPRDKGTVWGLQLLLLEGKKNMEKKTREAFGIICLILLTAFCGEPLNQLKQQCTHHNPANPPLAVAWVVLIMGEHLSALVASLCVYQGGLCFLLPSTNCVDPLIDC